MKIKTYLDRNNIFLLIFPLLAFALLTLAITPVSSTALDCSLLDQIHNKPISGAFEHMLRTKCEAPLVREGVVSFGSSPIFGDPDLSFDFQVNAVDPPPYTAVNTTQNETSVSVNPVTGTICVAYNDSWHWDQGDGIAGFSRSTDGGKTFRDGGFFPPGLGESSWGDPSVVWRKLDGYFYYASLHAGSLGFWRSTDDCATFEWMGRLHTGNSDDKELLAIDNNPASPYYGRIYAAWTEINSFKVYHSYSDDGMNWVDLQFISQPFAFGAQPVVAPNGDMYVAWVRWDVYPFGDVSQEIVKSTDGGETFAPVTYPAVDTTLPYDETASNADNCNRPALNGNTRHFPLPTLAIDDGGCLHIVYSYDPNGHDEGDVVDVFYRRSCDGGLTWEPELRLNDDTGQTDQFLPALTVIGNTVSASWYDKRLDPANNILFDRFASVSLDGGHTWGPNQRISDVSSPIYSPYISCYHGDYDQMAAYNRSIYHIWSDDRNVLNAHPDPDIWFDLRILPPILLSPPDGSIAQPLTNLLLTWETVPGADSYHLQLDDSPSFDSPILDVSGVPNPERVITDPLKSFSIYYWRIGVMAGSDSGPFSEPNSFTTEGRQFLPTIRTPEGD